MQENKAPHFELKETDNTSDQVLSQSSSNNNKHRLLVCCITFLVSVSIFLACLNLQHKQPFNRAAATQPPHKTIITKTANGAISGTILPSGVSQFLGIPYAEPPVGERRFRQTVPVNSWKPTVLNATSFGKMCPQPYSDLSEFDENCLFINVWTPAENLTESKLPVMLFIHGGSFEMGAASDPLYNGEKLSLEGVVVATINYRLGPLALLASEELATEDSSFPSTGGVLYITDQIEAIRWLKRNAKAFGGNGENLTIFGESAGGLSVCTLLALPQVKGLFQNAIVESGACLGAWGPMKPTSAIERSKVYMASHGVSSISEMRKLDAAVFGQGPLDLLPPTTDNFLFVTHPKQAFLAGEISLPEDGTLVIGATNFDGVLPYYGDDILPATELEFRKLLALYFPAMRDNGKILEECVELYSPTTETFGETWVKINADLCVTCPSRDVALNISHNRRRTFVYEYSYQPTSNNLAPHAAELTSVFGNRGYDLSFSEEVSRRVRRRWANVARTGSPGAGWDEFSAATDVFWKIDQTDRLVERFFTDKCSFWDRVASEESREWMCLQQQPWL